MKAIKDAQRDNWRLLKAIDDVLELSRTYGTDQADGLQHQHCHCCDDDDGHTPDCPIPALERWNGRRVGANG